MRTPVSAFSTGWAQPVRIFQPYSVYSILTDPLDAFFYDIYTHISELHLASVGLDVNWSDVTDIATDNREDRWGESREYFSLPIYRLPVGKMKLM